ncbi:hypothetical protein CCACVL1_07274, partial [Corchorus capsularis]
GASAKSTIFSTYTTTCWSSFPSKGYLPPS